MFLYWKYLIENAYISNTEIVNTTISEPMIIWVRQVERYQALANAVQISLIIINILQLELQKTLKQVKIDLID